MLSYFLQWKNVGDLRIEGLRDTDGVFCFVRSLRNLQKPGIAYRYLRIRFLSLSLDFAVGMKKKYLFAVLQRHTKCFRHSVEYLTQGPGAFAIYQHIVKSLDNN